jgi:hypothetical protein
MQSVCPYFSNYLSALSEQDLRNFSSVGETKWDRMCQKVFGWDFQWRNKYAARNKNVEYRILNVEYRRKEFYPSRASGSNDRFLLIQKIERGDSTLRNSTFLVRYLSASGGFAFEPIMGALYRRDLGSDQVGCFGGKMQS